MGALYEIGQKRLKHECEKRWDRSLESASLGGGIVRGLLKTGFGAESDEHHHRHRHRRWLDLFLSFLFHFDLTHRTHKMF